MKKFFVSRFASRNFFVISIAKRVTVSAVGSKSINYLLEDLDASNKINFENNGKKTSGKKSSRKGKRRFGKTRGKESGSGEKGGFC